MAVVAVAVGAYLVMHLNDEIRREIERHLAEHYPHLDVRVGDARLIEGKGIEISDLSLRQRGTDAEVQPILEIEEIFLVCPVQFQTLLHGLPAVRQVVIRRPHLRVARLADGSWNVESLMPLPKAEERPIQVVVKKGLVEIVPDPRAPDSRIAIREVTSVLRPDSPTVQSAGPPGHCGFAFAISATSPLCKQIKLAGRADAAERKLQMTGRLEGISVTGEDLAGFPPHLATFASQLQQLRGSLRLKSCELRQASQPGHPAQFSAHFECDEVEIRHRDLPDAVTGVSGEFLCDNKGLHAPHVSGKSGSAAFELALERSGWSERAPLTLAATVSNLNLRERHWKALPAIVRDVWEKYRAQGTIDVPRCQISYDGRRFRPDIELACRDVSLVAEKFPYPLRHVRGNVRIRPTDASQGPSSNLELNLVGEAAQRPVQIDAKYLVDMAQGGQLSHPVGWIRVTGTGLVVDEPLLAALPDGTQRFVRDLRPEGPFDLLWLASRSDPRQAETLKQLDLILQGGSVNYAKFPYPLHNVRGEVHARGDAWDFVNLSAAGGGGTIHCHGRLLPAPPAPAPPAVTGPQLSLQFNLERIELDSTLYEAVATLSPQARIAWDSLDPNGRINSTVSYLQTLGGGQPRIEYSVEPCEQSVSIKPAFFPYRIDQLEGRVHFGAAHATFQGIRGRHGPTTLVADGAFRQVGEGGFSLDLSRLSVDRLVVEKELVSALPACIQRVVTKLNPRGQISLDGSDIHLSRGHAADPVACNWKLNFDMHQASLDCGVQLDNISGSIALAGHGRGEEFSADGELDLDSVRWNRFFFDSMQGPLYADPTQVVLGQRAAQTRGIPQRRITANAYGGKVAGDAVVTLEHPSRFTVSAEYQAGDLHRLVTETWPTREDVTGLIYGTLQLQGMSQSPETVTGEGVVALREAELYQLPQVIRLFKILRLREPDQTAFTQADARFQISGRQVYFEDLKLKGDALSLHGGGMVDFDQRLRLVFSSDPVPSNSPLAGLRTIMRQASKQVMQLHVGGTIANPQFNPEPLAGLNHALQQIQQELDPQARAPAGERGAQRLFGPPPR